MDSVWGKSNSSPVRDLLSLVKPSLVKFIIIIIIERIYQQKLIFCIKTFLSVICFDVIS